jgi:hypothetical protein
MKSPISFIFHTLLLGILLIALTTVFTEFSGLLFLSQVLAFGVLTLFVFVGFVSYNSGLGRSVFFLSFLLYMLDLLFLWSVVGEFYVVLLVISLVGFLTSIPHKKKHEQIIPKDDGEPYSVVFDEPEEVKTKHSPGKFVASKRSNRYHAPKCEWAKKITKERRVWFTSKEEAWEQGYRAHSCLE